LFSVAFLLFVASFSVCNKARADGGVFEKTLLYRALRTRSRRGARALAPGANSQFLLHTVILYQALKKSFGDHYTRDAGLCARVDTGNSL
jgi:hypothetical protein